MQLQTSKFCTINFSAHHPVIYHSMRPDLYLYMTYSILLLLTFVITNYEFSYIERKIQMFYVIYRLLRLSYGYLLSSFILNIWNKLCLMHSLFSVFSSNKILRSKRLEWMQAIKILWKILKCMKWSLPSLFIRNRYSFKMECASHNLGNQSILWSFPSNCLKGVILHLCKMQQKGEAKKSNFMSISYFITAVNCFVLWWKHF